MRTRNKIIIIIIIIVGYNFLPLDQSNPMSVSTEHCFAGDTNWGEVDRCIAETRLNEYLSANTLYWAIGGIIFVLVAVWLMLDRFSSKLKEKNLSNNTEPKKQDELRGLKNRIEELEKDKPESKPKNDSDEINELEKKIRETYDEKTDNFSPSAKWVDDKEKK